MGVNGRRRTSCPEPIAYSWRPLAGRPRGRAGFSLIEAMVSLAAGLAVLGAAFEGLRQFQQRLTVQQQRIAVAQDVRLGLQVLDAELRLAGTGALPTAPALLKAGEQEVEFQANLSSLVTTLTENASVGQVDLAVQSGTDWPKGKRVVLCAGDQCAENRLARDGRSHGLTLTAPLAQAFAAGSMVTVANQVRYYLREDDQGKLSLMRMVDGGANTLIGRVGSFRLSYRDRHGRLTQVQEAIIRVRVELGMEDGGWSVMREIGIRSP